MEDERGDVGHGSDGVVLEPPLSENLHNENLVENMDCENQVVEESYEEGGDDDGEIMVEIVGSDVFVDGVSGNEEADFGPSEIGDLGGAKKEESGTTNFPEAMDVSSEEGEKDEIGESDSGLSDSRDEKSEVVKEEMDVKLCETVDANPEIEPTDNVSAVSEEVVKVADPMVISEAKETKDEAVDEKGGVEEEKEVLPLGDDAMLSDCQIVASEVNVDPIGECPENVRVDGIESVAGKGDLVDASGGEVSLNPNNGEGLENVEFDGIESVVEKVDSVNASGGEVSINPNNGEGFENAEVDGVESVVKDVDLVNATARGESLGDGTSEDASVSAKTELKGTNGDCQVEAKLIDEKEVFVAESKDSVVKSDGVVSDVQNENEGCINDFHGTKIEPSNEKPLVSEKGDDNTGEELGDMLDSKDECLKGGGDLEKDMGNQTHIISNEPTQVTDGCDIDAVNKDERGPDVESLPDTKESQSSETLISSTVGEVIENQPNEPLIASTVGEVIENQPNEPLIASAVGEVTENQPNEPLFGSTVGEVIEDQLNIVNGDGSSEKIEEIDSEESKQSLECHNAEIHASTNVKETEDSILHDNPLDSLEVGFDNAVEEGRSPQKKEQEVFVEITEMSDHGVGKIESIDITTSEVIGAAAVSDITQDITDYSELPVDIDHVPLLDGGEIEEKSLSDMITSCDEENRSGEEERESDDKLVKSTSSLKLNQPGYFSPPENEGDYVFSDLVWGKVRSHPWWPGQIFDPADASETAVKHYKRDSYLVAYFGDRTFAWNESPLLKPFRSHFSQAAKQSNSEAFQNAVTSALEEVSRRVELSLTCSCIPRDVCNKTEAQIIENTGIRTELSRRYGVDRSSRASYFEPDRFLEYVKYLAPRASSGADRLDVVILQAQLSAFYRFEKYHCSSVTVEMVAFHNDKHTPMTEYSVDSQDESFVKKRKATDDPSLDGYDKRVSIYAAKVPNLTSQAPNPKPSFKIGECIRRVASQLTGSTPLGKDEMVIDGSPKISVNEMLLQLEIVAQNPNERHDFLNAIHPFFMGFRSSIAMNRRGRKKRAEQTAGGPAEEFEFDDVNDSYWTDRIVQNYSEEQLLTNSSANGLGNLQPASFGVEKQVKAGRKPNSRKRYSIGNSPSALSEFDERVKRRKQESSPAELILSFAEKKCVPSEINLNKIFRRFGPLMESETEVDHESGCAKVIFKRGSDAEVALNSSEKFNIFGSVLVNYQIGYEPLISVKVSPLAIPYPQEDMTMMQ